MVGGFYTRLIEELSGPGYRLRAVVLNNNLYLDYNKATEGMEDPGGQYMWLEEVLEQSRNATDEKVRQRQDSFTIPLLPSSMPDAGSINSLWPSDSI